MTGAPKVLVFLDVDEWRWRCETCGERSQAFTREFVAALDAGNHVSAAHSGSHQHRIGRGCGALPELTNAVSDALFQAGFIGDRKEVAGIAAAADAAVAAVLRALPECETVIAAARQAAVAKHGTLIGSLPEVLADAVLAAIAKLADDA